MPRAILRISDHARPVNGTTISFSTEALLANFLRLQNEWEAVQASHGRDAIHQYLSAVFETVAWWAKEGKAANVLIGRCTCEGINRSSRNRLLL